MFDATDRTYIEQVSNMYRTCGKSEGWNQKGEISCEL